MNDSKRLFEIAVQWNTERFEDEKAKAKAYIDSNDITVARYALDRAATHQSVINELTALLETEF